MNEFCTEQFFKDWWSAASEIRKKVGRRFYSRLAEPYLKLTIMQSSFVLKHIEGFIVHF